MNDLERSAFRNFFITAMLIGGLAMGAQGAVFGWRSFGAWWGMPLGFALGFLYVAPIAAALVYLKILADRWFPPKAGPQKTRWLGATLVGLSICAALVVSSLAMRHLG